MDKFIWTPQDLHHFGKLGAPRGSYELYALSTGLADRRTGRFELTKASAASQMGKGRCKSTADNAFTWLERHGIVRRDENIQRGKQRANRWVLMPRDCWTVAAARARAVYEGIMAKLKQRREEKRKRLQLLNGVNSSGAGATTSLLRGLSDDDIAQEVAKRAMREGWDRDYERQEREIAEMIRCRDGALRG